MCGIAGILETPQGHDGLQQRVDAMVATIVHRGPDESGTAVLAEQGVALGMRRLSILDIEGGHQPMWDETRRHCLVFNGEIYNFASLRAQLVDRGHVFVTDHSDTEVLVHGFEEWREGLFERLNGMFALAIWDRERGELYLSRDRMGKKPLYVGRTPGGWIFGSELKALLVDPGLPRDIDPVAVEQYLAFDYVLGPRTMLRSVQKLQPAHWARLTADGLDARPFWEPRFEHAPYDRAGAVAELDGLLDEATRCRMVADVPVGLFLSGGLDSTTVGYYMRRHADDVRSFSIGFETPEFDESSYAQLAADSLGTEHHLETFSQDRVRDLIPKIAEILDEPMGDQSILPTFLLSQVTRRDVTVALGGDGSDELFMGYKSYRPLKAAWQLDRLPMALRRATARAARMTPEGLGSRPIRSVRFARSVDERPLHRLLAHLGSFKGDARTVLSPEARGELPASVYDGASQELLRGLNGLSSADETVAGYIRGYLAEDILVKVDRASMATSLEVRAPFLDPAVIDFALRLPTRLKLNGFTGKDVLRRLMRGRIPDDIIDRPKQGFGVPLNDWLRESLAGLVREQLAPDRLAAGGLFDPAAVSALVDDHVSGAFDHGHRVWLLLQFQLWRERWLAS